MTVQEAAWKALDVQDACSLSGVLIRFREVVVDVLWVEAARLHQGTEWVNRNPISVLFSCKLAALAGIEPVDGTSLDRYRKALQQCREIASGRQA